jgi:hypothetical protein
MTHACGTNAIIENNENVSKQRDRLTCGDDHQKGNESCKAKTHEDLNILSSKIDYRNAVLSRET